MRTFTHDDRGGVSQDWVAAFGAAPLPSLDLARYRRVVVVGAHPDDESLGAGGLVAMATAAGLPTHPPDVMAHRRRDELDAAAAALGLEGDVLTRLAVPDGRVGDHTDGVVAAIVDLVGDGRDCLLVAPYRKDGHPDHEAVGRCAATAAHRTGATLAEYPVWLWHAGERDDLPVDAMVRLPLSGRARAAKRAAIASHTSQVRPLSPRPGDEVMLSASVLEHFEGDQELFVLTSAEGAPDDRLDRLHADDADPWGAQSRWYERRKRSLLLAALPKAGFVRGLEVGCSTGVLTEALLERTESLVAMDSSPVALDLARHRLGERVDLRRMAAPREWPEGSFDLVVLSEVGYFLSPASLDGLVDRVTASLTRDGVVVLCHWRHRVTGWPLDGPDVHRAFARSDLPAVAATYRDRDVEIIVHAAPEQWPDPLR